MEFPYYNLVPKEREANLKWRADLIRKGSASASAAEELWIMCARDPLFYINSFCFIFEPRMAAQLPFITYEFQDGALETIFEAHGNFDLVIEKSRDMGASWMCVTSIEWHWHFHKRRTFLLLSRKEELVDGKGKDPRSLFAKIDFLHKHQPGWLLPDRTRMQMHYSNDDNDSSMDGESTNKFAGIADRRYSLLIDEFSKMENQDSIFRGTRDVSDCRLFNFTPQGADNMASRVAHSEDYRKITLHWSRHPIKSIGLYRVEKDGEIEFIDTNYWTPKRQTAKNYVAEEPNNPRFKFRSPWYDLQCKRADTDKEIAQELDIDYLASSFQYFKPSLLAKAIAKTSNPEEKGEFEYSGFNAEPISFQRNTAGDLDLWTVLDGAGNPPRQGRSYVVGADISAGTGASNSVLVIGEARSHEQVGEMASPHIRPEELAKYAVSLCRWFCDEQGNPAALIWEAPGPGREFGAAVKDLGFSNVYYFRPRSRWAKAKKVPGWWPTKDEKRDLIGEYRRAIYESRYLVHSRLQLEECRHYIHHPNQWVEHSKQTGSSILDPSGARENHGDRPMAGALCWLQMCMLFPSSEVHAEIDQPVGQFQPLSKIPDWTPNDLPVQEAPAGSIMARRAMMIRERQEKDLW